LKKIYFIHYFNSLRNCFKIIINSEYNKIYIPNLAIKNIIIIDPNKLKYVNSIPRSVRKDLFPEKFNVSSRFIVNFKFDEENKLLKYHQHPAFKACRELFVEGKDVKECAEYFYLKEQIAKKGKFKNCKNENDILKYFAKKKILFESIKKIGVKKSILSNIQFIVDKNFDLVKINAGNHRLAISKILKLKKIPIEIKIIHSNCFESNSNFKINIKRINNVIKFVESKYS